MLSDGCSGPPILRLQDSRKKFHFLSHIGETLLSSVQLFNLSYQRNLISVILKNVPSCYIKVGCATFLARKVDNVLNAYISPSPPSSFFLSHFHIFYFLHTFPYSLRKVASPDHASQFTSNFLLSFFLVLLIWTPWKGSSARVRRKMLPVPHERNVTYRLQK